MTRSESISALVAALVKAQPNIKAAAKSSVNPHFKSKYADLAEVEDACLPALNKAGIAVLQPVSAHGADVTVTTLLAHESGEWLAEDLTLTAVQNTPQAIGSAITYGRRYGLAAMVGVAPEDDDGEAATRSAGYTVQAPPPSSDPHDYATTQNTQPKPALPAGQVFIARVDTSPTKNPNVRKYRVTFSTGEFATTINERLGTLCEQIASENLPVTVEMKSTKWGQDLLAVHRIEAELPDIDIHTEPLTDADIPF